MSTFNTQRAVSRNTVLSPKQQLTIGEVFADASLTYLSRADASSLATDSFEHDSA